MAENGTHHGAVNMPSPKVVHDEPGAMPPCQSCYELPGKSPAGTDGPFHSHQTTVISGNCQVKAMHQVQGVSITMQLVFIPNNAQK